MDATRRRPQRCVVEWLEPRRMLANAAEAGVPELWGGTITHGTAMAFAPDGRLFVLHQHGIVRVIDVEGNLLLEPALTLEISPGQERGLLGIAFDPDFEKNSYLYLNFSTPFPSVLQIARFGLTGNVIDPASRIDIFQLGSSVSFHQGGAIHFGADGMLYAGRGDNTSPESSQRIDNLFGKIIRINPAAYDPADPLAVIPAENPTSFPGIAGTPVGVNRAIWAVGLRNPFTLAVHPVTGRILINDVGSAFFEEINEGLAGRNYGWPLTEGGFDPVSFPDFTPPIYYYGHTGGSSAGRTIAGGAFYPDVAPDSEISEYDGKYFFADYVAGWIGYIDPDAPPATHTQHSTVLSGVRDIVDLKFGPDGALYYLRRGAEVGGVYRYVLPQSLPPTGTIQAPLSYNAGDTVNFSGIATDPNQGTLPPSAFTWSVDFHYNGSTLPVLPPLSGLTVGSFQVPRKGEASLDQFYRIHLTVTDNTGLQHSVHRDLVPNTADITLQTFPQSLILHVDGEPYATPVTLPQIVGYQRTLAAPSNQLHNDQWHQFISWLDTPERVREIFSPPVNTTYLAAYAPDAFAPTVVSSQFLFEGVLRPDPPHRIRVSFDEDVSASLDSADLVLVNTTTGQTIPADQVAVAWDAGSNSATFAYVGGTHQILPDGDYVATLKAIGIMDPPGHPMAEDHVLSFHVLAGDANRDGRVDIDDFKLLAANFGQSNRMFSQGDFNYDGVVNLADFNILASRFGVVPPGRLTSSAFSQTLIFHDDRSNDDTLGALPA